MNTIHALIFITFSFIGPPSQGVVSFEATKAPYIFNSEQDCEDAVEAIVQQSPDAKYTPLCVPVIPSNTK